MEKFGLGSVLAGFDDGGLRARDRLTGYVDTFEAEDAIDLNATAAFVTELEQTSKTTDATITAFCLELGIKPPF